MKPIRITAGGFEETSFAYAFDAPREQDVIQTGEDLKKYLKYAFFGEEAVNKGEVSFEFVINGKNYLLKRDLSTGDVLLTENGKKLSDKQTKEAIASFVPMSEKAFADFLSAGKHASYEGVTTDVNKFTEDFLLKDGLTKDKAEQSAEAYKEQIGDLNLVLSELKEFTSDEKKLRKKLREADEEIQSIRKDANRLQELITAGTIYADNFEKLSRAEEALAEEEKKGSDAEEARKLIARSNELKEHFGLISAVTDVDDEIKTISSDLEGKEESLTKLRAEIAAGEKVLKKKQDAFLEATERIRALNTAFDEMIEKNKKEESSLAYATRLTEENFVDEDGKIADLKALVAELSENKKETDAALRAKRAEYAEKKQDAEYRKAIREGACFEITVESKTQYLKTVKESLEKDRLLLRKLQTEYNRNMEELAICENNYALLFGNGTDSKQSLNQLIRDYNDLERIKQSLYRNQILSATLLQDINAIDKKISENTDARAVANENKVALESAKETLIAYMDKCKEAIDKKIEERSLIVAERKFFEDLDSLEYGSRCPVCSAPISDKTDAERKAAALAKRDGELKNDLERLYGIQAEYEEKLGRINLSLGSYESTIASNAHYVESLNATKTAKLTALKKIYEENHVQGHAELTRDLEQAISEIARYGASLSDLKGIVARREDCEKILVVLEERIHDIENNIIPGEEALVKELTDDIEKYGSEFKKFTKTIEGPSALDKLDETIREELEEDALYREMKELTEKSDALAEDLARAEQEIEEREKNAYLFSDGKGYDRGTACLKYVAEMYEQVVGEIRKAEADKQKKQDEFIAVDGLLKDKKARADEMEKEVSFLKNRKEIGEAYLEKVKQSENYDDAVLHGKSYSDARLEILSAEQYEEKVATVENHEKAMAQYAYEIETLKELNANNKDAFDALETNVVAAKELDSILNGKLEEYEKLSNELSVSTVVGKKIAELEQQLASAKKSLADVVAVSDGNASDLLIVKINAGLDEMMPELKAKLKLNGLSVLFTDKTGLLKELEKLDDNQYAAFALAVIVAEKQIVEETLRAACSVRVARFKASVIDDETRGKIRAYAEKNNVVAIFHR